MKLKLTLYFLIALGALALASCTKTMDLPGLPQNKILSYKVVNLQDTVIYGAVDNIDHTITVYVPFYLNMTVIDPEIKVSDGAKIEGRIEPVSVNAKDVKYKVTGADGSTNVYTLQIINQSISSLNVDWVGSDEIVTSPKNMLPTIRGNFQSRNGAAANILLTNRRTADTVSIPTSTIGIQPSDNDYDLYGAYLPATVDTGYYDVQLTFMGHTAKLARPVQVVYQKPDLLIPSREVKQGGIITFNSTATTVFVGLKSASVTLNGTTYNLPVINYDREVMTLQTPDNLPVGLFNYTAVYRFEFEGWPVTTKYGALTVTAK